MRQNSSGCFTAALAGFARMFILFAWIARPVLFNAAFGGFIIPCLGFVFLPFTTLMYLILVQGVGSISGIDWLWIILSVVIDLATISAAAVSNRNYIPQGYPGAYPPQPPGVPPM